MAFSVKLIETYPGFGPELTTDGNMEDAPATNWPGTNATVAMEGVAAFVHGGCSSLRVDATADNGYASQSITVEPGHKYRIGAWGLRSAAGHQWRLRIYIAGTVRWTGAWHNNAAWEEEVKFYRIPNTITTIQLRLEVDSLNDRVYIDDVTVKREAPVPMTTIDLFYSATDTWAMLEKGFMPNDPERREVWGGHLEDQLVRQEDGKRVIPLKLHGKWATTDALIDDVNGLEEILRHAARYRKDGWGGECFLEFRLHSATHGIWYPVCSGQIDKGDLMNACASIMTGGHRETKNLVEVGVTIVCESYWESPFTYDLSNLLNNPGFEEWNAGICDSQPDGWSDWEIITAGTGTNSQETDEVLEGCEALRIEVAGINNGDYKGVRQAITATLQADTQYTLLAWVQNAAITNGIVYIFVHATGIAIIGTALNTGVARADYAQVSCQFTPTAAHIAAGVLVVAVILGNVPAAFCTGIAHIDKMLVMESSNVPTGWMSSSYLMNHYDRTANHINYLSVCDVPGEVKAEIKAAVALGNTLSYLRIAKRTRDDPHGFLWQLTPCAAYTRWETGAAGACVPGRTDGILSDSDKVIDATAPDGNRIDVNFATSSALVPRCYWDITTDLASYYGRFVLLVLAKKSGTTDTIKMRVLSLEDPGSVDEPNTVPVPTSTGGWWPIVEGFGVLPFPIGTRDDKNFGAGNNWRIYLFASRSGTTDTLAIAGAYLVAVDEAYFVGGGTAVWSGGTTTLYAKEMDGDRGLYGYDSATDTHYGNYGAVGSYPTLTPRAENYLYFIVADATREVDITDTFRASLQFRPRGIFLRGSNPG